MIDREWWVQVNLDDLAHVTAQMETTEERGQWFEGFIVGAQGHPARDSWDGFKRMGFDFGASCHAEAVAFRSSKSAAGKASVDARRAKYGSASPNSVRTVIEHTSEQKPEQKPEQTIEQTSNQPTTNNQQPTTRNQKRTTKSFSAEAEELYSLFPLKVAPDKAKKAIEEALKRTSFEALKAAVTAYAEFRRGEDPHYTKQPAGWFNDSRYLDDPSTWIKTTKQSKNGVKHDGFSKTDYFAGLDSVPSY